VWSVEWWADLAQTATANLARAQVRNVTVVVGDGGAGLPEHAPFDAIAVSAAAPVVPRPLVEQLADGGRLVQPIGPGGHDEVCLFSKHDRVLVPVRDVVPARFVSLTDRYGCP
jgi:protein-L-isoaspartate(D-aspartate) O-methyltransferase